LKREGKDVKVEDVYEGKVVNWVLMKMLAKKYVRSIWNRL